MQIMRKILTGIIMVAMVTSSVIVWFVAPANARMSPLEYGVNRPGADLYNTYAANEFECAQICDEKPECHSITYNQPGVICYIKYDVPAISTANPNDVSSVKLCCNEVAQLSSTAVNFCQEGK